MAKHKLDFCLKLYKNMLLKVHIDVVVFTESKWRKGICYKVCSCECGGNALRFSSFFFKRKCYKFKACVARRDCI